jgi:hypothetical protein
MHWLLTEGGFSLTEQIRNGWHALMLAAIFGRFPAVQYLLGEHGASITERDNCGRTVWGNMYVLLPKEESAAELSFLLKVMVMLDDAPADFIIKLLPQHTNICTRGRHLRAELPSFLEQQQAAVVVHCSLPAVLQSLVATYAATTPEDMWTDGLRVHATCGKRKRAREAGEAEGVDVAPPRHSLRLHQKRLRNRVVVDPSDSWIVSTMGTRRKSLSRPFPAHV